MDVGGGIFIGVGACKETEQGVEGGPGESGLGGGWAEDSAVTFFSRRLPGALLQGRVAAHVKNHTQLSDRLAFPGLSLCVHKQSPRGPGWTVATG